MFDYQIFGGVLRSDIAFPELAPARGCDPTWTLRSIEGPPPDQDGEPLGVDVVTVHANVALSRRRSAFRLAFDDTGAFDVGLNGRTITWHWPRGASLDSARADLTGRVLAVALHASGTLCLHGSAVEMDGAAIGLVAPKLHGKSTLSLALVGAGGRLLTDDTLPVHPGPPAMARPGLHATRLWKDSAARVAIGTAQPTRAGEKQVFSAMPDDRLMHEACPLAAVYVLCPVADAPVAHAARRIRVSPIESALVLMGHSKIAPLLTKSEAPVLFNRAVALARQVPVYRLEVVRDLERLPEAVSIIREWHAGRRAAELRAAS